MIVIKVAGIIALLVLAGFLYALAFQLAALMSRADEISDGNDKRLARLDLLLARLEPAVVDGPQPIERVPTDTVPTHAAITPEAIVGWRGDEGRIHDVGLAWALADMEDRMWSWRHRQAEVA